MRFKFDGNDLVDELGKVFNLEQNCYVGMEERVEDVMSGNFKLVDGSFDLIRAEFATGK